ncbi:MAG TPA: hypothetical protein H9831_04645, partial [Candidatus Eisenbergiella pullistercoris]|nr:hypothetical protein [Candidatus Eisenbergiella pullistercoris]
SGRIWGLLLIFSVVFQDTPFRKTIWIFCRYNESLIQRNRRKKAAKAYSVRKKQQVTNIFLTE